MNAIATRAGFAPGAAAEAQPVSGRVQRRSREELEALASRFVAAPAASAAAMPAAPPDRRRPMAALAGVALVGVCLLAWLRWPAAAPAIQDSAPVVNEAEAWARRVEAERERQRLELERSRQFLGKLAAADSALVSEMGERAQRLATRAPASAPARTAARAEEMPEPTPRALEPAPRKAPVSRPAEPRPAATPPVVAASAVQALPAQASAARAPPAADTGTTAQPAEAAAAPRCNIHVSELSSSGRLTYADVARMKGARKDERGHVYTPPVAAAGYRSVVFAVQPNGCVEIVRSSLQR